MDDFFRCIVQRYNHNNYWKMREKVINQNNKCNILLKYFFLYLIKRSDAFNNASFGTRINSGANFKSPPNLPHGLNGIIVHPDVKCGRNCTIFQQVTIGESRKNSGVPVLGDNVTIGAGAKLIGSIYIGNNVTIGANAVVNKNLPDNSLAVGVPAKVISKYA